MTQQTERRYVIGSVRAETPDSGPARIIGSAAVFNMRSENLGGFREIIKPGAFDGVLGDDVRALFNHDPNYILGRTASNTLRLSVDDTGLLYDIEAPDTQTVRDMILAPLKRGDVTQSSFQFTVARDGDYWYQDEEGIVVREVTRIARLFDVGPVTLPAYPDTNAASRGLQDFLASDGRLKALTQKRSRERLLQLLG